MGWPEHYCKRVVYDINITITETNDGLDEIVQFELEYIRDPIDTDSIDQFFDTDGNARVLQNDVIYAVCDYNELNDIEWQECFERMAINPEPRVLQMSTDELSSPFSMTFGLTGDDRDLVSDETPLTINVAQSNIYLYHALYSGNFQNCGTLCSEHTSTVAMDLMEFSLVAPTETTEYWNIAFEGTMPIFDPDSDMQCDESFCTLVLVLNFESKQPSGEYESRRLEAHMPIRLLQESATQAKQTKVKALQENEVVPPDEEPNPDSPDEGSDSNSNGGDIIILILVVVLAIASLISCCIVGFCYRRRRNPEAKNEELYDDLGKPIQEQSQVPEQSIFNASITRV